MPTRVRGSSPAAIYASGICPAKHNQQMTRNYGNPAEGQSNAEAERFCLEHCRQFPGAVQVHLGPGDFMVYRNLAWHTGNYITYQPRATIHDVVRYEGKKDWTDWQQTKLDAVKRMKEKTSGNPVLTQLPIHAEKQFEVLNIGGPAAAI